MGNIKQNSHMKTFFAAALAAAASAKLMTEGDYEFLKFVSKYAKRYATTEEFEARKEHFINFWNAVKEINSNPARTHTAGINHLSDLTPGEWDRMMGLKGIDEPSHEGVPLHETVLTYPTAVDWRDGGYVSEVKNQGSCGSCWAFSSTGALESAARIFNTADPLLSEQQLVDCSSSYGNHGCNGGWYYYAYNYLKAGQLLETEGDYPYAGVNQTCSDDSLGVMSDTGYVTVGQNNDAMKSAIAQQPCNVAVAAGNYHFQSYTGGILSASGCPTRIDHAILAVGYGSENGLEYWIVKNSWGATWGENGYVRMEIADTRKGTCGINQNVAYPTI